MQCPACQARNETAASFCWRCGTSLTGPAGAPARGRETGPVRGSAPAAGPPPVPPEAFARPMEGAAGYALSSAPAGFWVRVAASIIDYLILAAPSAALAICTGAGGGAPRHVAPGVPGQAVPCAAILLAWLYGALMESSSYQATLGKMVLGLRVCDEHGRRITFARATARYFAKYLSSLILMIGYVMVAFTKHKQGLHDMIAGTLVVRTQPGPLSRT